MTALHMILNAHFYHAVCGVGHTTCPAQRLLSWTPHLCQFQARWPRWRCMRA